MKKLLTSLFHFLGKNFGTIVVPIVVESVTLFIMKKLMEKKSKDQVTETSSK